MNVGRDEEDGGRRPGCRTSRLRLTAVSRSGRQEDLDRSRKGSFDHHLVKTVTFDKLLAHLMENSDADR